jgi:folate-binding protein YgfZ
MTNDASPPSGRLLHLGLLRFTGPDALSFLQGQVSNDTRRLADGQSLLAAYSSPQGRVLALLHLLPHSSGTVAILPRDLVSPTLEALRRFVLRAKVKIEDAGDQLMVAGRHADPHAGDQPSCGYRETDGVGTAPVNHDPSRYWVIGAASQTSAAPQAVERAWRLADIRAGLPQIYLATRETFVAQMLNLDLLDGISFNKGCYTGQEIIARTQHLGRIKRRLYRLRLPLGEWTVGQAVRLTDGRTGRLTEVMDTGAGFEALAVLPVESAAGTGTGSDAGEGGTDTSPAVAATPLPLPYQL